MSIQEILEEYGSSIDYQGWEDGDIETAKSQIEALILEARIDELKNVSMFINTGGESFMDYYKERLTELQEGKKNEL